LESLYDCHHIKRGSSSSPKKFEMEGLNDYHLETKSILESLQCFFHSFHIQSLQSLSKLIAKSILKSIHFFLIFPREAVVHFWTIYSVGQCRPVRPVCHTSQTGVSVLKNRPKTLSLLNSFPIWFSLPRRSLSSRSPPCGDLGSPQWKTRFQVGIWSSSPW
jgi:hypothetical protein